MSAPQFTCILVSHDKPDYVAQALASLAAQTFGDWEALVFDSGVLFDQGFFIELPFASDPRFQFIRSWETNEIRRERTMASWCFNECFRRKLVRGTYVTYLCDDDLLNPGALAAFERHIREHPRCLAMYGSVDMTLINARGQRVFLWENAAREVKGACCGGGTLDGHVDYLQLCHHVDVLKVFADDEYWSENRNDMRHADGIFLEQVGRHFPILPVPAKIGENRKVPSSLNDGGERLIFLEELGRKAEADRQLRRHWGLAGRILIRSGIADWWRRRSRIPA